MLAPWTHRTLKTPLSTAFSTGIRSIRKIWATLVTFHTFFEPVSSFSGALRPSIFTWLLRCWWSQCLKIWETLPYVGIDRRIWGCRAFCFMLISFRLFWKYFGSIILWDFSFFVTVWGWDQLWSSFGLTVSGKTWATQFLKAYYRASLRFHSFSCLKGDDLTLNGLDNWDNLKEFDSCYYFLQDSLNTFSFQVKD